MHKFKRGQIVYYDDPYACVVRSDYVGMLCSACFKPTATEPAPLACPECRTIVYCNPQCQLQDAENHTVECALMRNSNGVFLENSRLTVRALARYMSERVIGNFVTHSFFEHQRTIEDLLTHYDDANEAAIEHLRRKAEALKMQLDRLPFDVSVQTILEMMLKIKINGHNVYDTTKATHKKIGCALYLGASKIDHTCEVIENYAQTFHGPNFVLCALKNFSVANSLEIRTHYIPPNLPVRRRQKELSTRYHFLCECTRCLLDMANDEPNLPENLEGFVDLTPNQQWVERAERYYRIVCRIPEKNYYHFTLASKLQLFYSRRDNLDPAVRYGLRALQGCMTFEDKKQVMFVLCQDMAKLGYNDPNHLRHQEFRTVYLKATEMFSIVFDEWHPLVKGLKRFSFRSRR